MSRSHSSGSSGSVDILDGTDPIDTNGLSIAKTLTLLRSQSANRSCADCRSALIDPSTVYASLYIVTYNDSKNNRQNNRSSVRKIALQDFHLTHNAFAPPSNAHAPAFEVVSNGASENDIIVKDNSNRRNRNSCEDDPAFSINKRFGGFGVFLCKRCAEAHRHLGIPVTVKRVADISLWKMEEAQFILSNGGNAKCWKIYEAYVPDQWKERRPINSSSLSDRILFCRAKYEALAFCLPQPGPLAQRAWQIILQIQQDQNMRAPGTAHLRNISSLSLMTSSNHTRKKSRSRSSAKQKKKSLPNRLIDYFCVVSSSMQLLPSKSGKNKKQKKGQYSKIASPEALDFWPHLTDCYPSQSTHGDMGYEDHISSFVMPSGCRPTLDPKPPAFSTFVLTMADGSFLYGGSLQIYDEHVDAEEIKRSILDTGYKGDFPDFLMHDGKSTNDSDVFFFPRCLVVLSRYAFFNLFRDVLLELYQISLIEAPLPIERYVSNFVCEVPLPPRGQIKVEFSFTMHRKFRIERPPINKLPMADFSYRPLFASLSVSNIIVVLGYILQECKVVIISEHYSLLTPVAEALLSAIFPFRWVGLYIPVAPLKMVGILQAPIPYLIGLHSDYFNTVDVSHRPNDAIFVDLDRDVIHIGEIPLPKIPEHDAQKMAMSLEEAGGSVYVIPNSGIKGCIMAGTEKLVLVRNENRPRYARMTTVTGLGVNSFFRDELFSICDLAYGKNDDQTERINGFMSISGQLISVEETSKAEKKKNKPSIVSPIKKPKNTRDKKANILSRSQAAMNQVHLLDMTEPEGFSCDGIRSAFLRFTVATFVDYQDSLVDNSKRDLFDDKKFVEESRSNGRSVTFLKRVLRSQFFQMFLEERKENPDIPEIRFFDESIIAKRNRSKRETLAKGGKKKPTPFLDDRKTWEVKKIFTPPPPNNLGLPDSAATYRYGTFPILDATRFGRIRAPTTWHQHASLESVIYATKFESKQSQLEIVKNALKPAIDTPCTIGVVAKQKARDLESALVALSQVPVAKRADMTNKSTLESQGGVKLLSTADTIMMDARRKQGILLDLIIRIQSFCRGFLTRNHFVENKYEILEARKSKERSERKSQQQLRNRLEEQRRVMSTRKAILIQSFLRMCIVRGMKRRMLVAIVTIQSAYRSSSYRKKWKLVKDSAIVIAKFFRARRTRILFQELRRLITTVQSRARGNLARSKMKFMIKQKLDLYTSQIFVLWTFLHTPLVFRTKFWPNISTDRNFMCLRIAELELLRLWDIARLPTCLNDSKYSDEISLYCDSIGISNEIYYRSKECAGLLQGDVSVISTNGNTLQFEEAERLQIYERLKNDLFEKDLSTIYRTFDIAPDEKMKKLYLSKTLWTKLVMADRSATFMALLFPELKKKFSISFTTPSSKGKRRFPKATKQVVPPIDHELWEEISIEGRTKKHVQEVAMLFITKVPEISKKLDSVRASKESNFDSFLLAATKAKGFQSTKQARRCIIQQYVHSNC